MLGVVAKAERRIAVVVDGRKNLFFHRLQMQEQIMQLGICVLFLHNIESRKHHSGLPCGTISILFLSFFKICCTRTDTCFQQTFIGSFNVLGFIPPFQPLS